MRRLTLLLLAGALGCPKPAPPAEPPPEAPPAPQPAPTADETLPPPYTADQIRAAWVPGLVIGWRIAQRDGAVAYQRWEVLAGDPATATIRFCDADEALTALTGCADETSAWTELRDHALFPAAATTRDEVDLHTPFGTHRATRYTVVDPDGSVRRFWFGLDTPGAPLKHTVEAGGVEVMTMEMVRRDPP